MSPDRKGKRTPDPAPAQNRILLNECENIDRPNDSNMVPNQASRRFYNEFNSLNVVKVLLPSLLEPVKGKGMLLLPLMSQGMEEAINGESTLPGRRVWAGCIVSGYGNKVLQYVL